jgi:hypothetical protein
VVLVLTRVWGRLTWSTSDLAISLQLSWVTQPTSE